ncbi:unnamed protein product [Sphagnum troendelagicum]|uniref:Exocyst complex subunit EXOC6/Sec15 C-terminal domain-containing protein n=1 Tax=Sphagnum troendelagicum TaxID=128251 RepID=A0ABP0UCD0_9BRYO
MDGVVPLVLSVLSTLHSIIGSLDAVINRVKTAASDYSQETHDDLLILKATLVALEKLARESDRNFGKEARGVLERMEKATDELKTKVESHTGLQRFFRHDNARQKLKSLQDIARNVWDLMQLQALCRDHRDDYAGEQWTCVSCLQRENLELKRLIEEMAESSVTRRSDTHQQRPQAEPSLENYFNSKFTECSQQIDNILSNDTLKEMTITTKKKDIFHMTYVVPCGATIEIDAAVIGVPSMAGYSGAVPECIQTVISFVEDCASFLSGTAEERHYYKLLGMHLVQLITVALPQLITNGTRRRLSVQEGIQLYLNACRFREFPGSTSFKREIKDKYPLIGNEYLELDLYKEPHAGPWEKLNERVWATINQHAFAEMNWGATFSQINWLPKDPLQAAEEDYLKPVHNYLQRLAKTLRHRGLIHCLPRIHNCFASVILELDDCIAGMFSRDEVEKFNIHALREIKRNLEQIQKFADEIDDTYGFISSSGLWNASKWVDLLMKVEPELFPDENFRRDYYLAVKERYNCDLDPGIVVRVCEKFDHTDGAVSTRS